MLCGHVDLVNAVKFYPTSIQQPQIILSGSVDKTIRVWKLSEPNPENTTVLHGHQASINCLTVCSEANIFASGSADTTIKIWRLHINAGSISAGLLQTIKASPRLFPLTLALHPLRNNGDVILAVGGTKSTVQVYVSSVNTPFEHQATLTGHEGWIRSVSISREATALESDLLLASASQDKYIRIWRICVDESGSASQHNNVIGVFEESLSNKRHKLKSSQRSYLLTFEALLLGHEDWIYTTSWHLHDSKLRLLSASADNSVAIWEPEESSGIWLCTTRLGEISAQKGSTTATGSTGGFWLGLWSADGGTILSLGRTGSWRIWNHDNSLDRWTQSIGISGHTKSITDIAWSKDGSYLLTTGSDQTTRLHAKWSRGFKTSWHEMSRPQIHGYDLNCIDSIGQTQFISGADEKLLRVFDEPRNTAELLHNLCSIQAENEQGLPVAASIPVLGLSNKVVHSTDVETPATDGNLDTEPSDSDLRPDSQEAVKYLPTEDQLARHTLWPEREKLYGHGYEISAVAVSHDGAIIATSCKASSLDHAVVRMYTTKDWREVKLPLTTHTLTVTALAFAKDDHYLLSVGRDRQWALYRRDVEHSEIYTLKYCNPKGHSRMILDGCWAPAESGRVFATASRDRTVKLWVLQEHGVECATTITKPSSVIAVDIAPQLTKESILIALGTESGEAHVYAFDCKSWTTTSRSINKEMYVGPIDKDP